MDIRFLVEQGRDIWGNQKLALNQIIPRLGTVFGDICRWERDALKDKDSHIEEELKKEMGNVIFATIRWCDDLGYDPEECIELAIESQKKFKK